MHWRCTRNAREIHEQCSGDAQAKHRRCTSNAREMHGRYTLNPLEILRWVSTWLWRLKQFWCQVEHSIIYCLMLKIKTLWRYLKDCPWRLQPHLKLSTLLKPHQKGFRRAWIYRLYWSDVTKSSDAPEVIDSTEATSWRLQARMKLLTIVKHRHEGFSRAWSYRLYWRPPSLSSFRGSHAGSYRSILFFIGKDNHNRQEAEMP